MIIIEEWSQLAKKKSVWQRYSTFGKKYLKILVKSLRGLKYTSICIIWAYPPRNSIQACGTQVTNRVVVYLKAMEKQRCWRSVMLTVATAWAESRMSSSPLSSCRDGLLSLLWHCVSLPAVCTQLWWTQKGFRSGSAPSPPWCSFFTCL